MYDTRRDDQGYPNRQLFCEIIEDIAKVTFMPITVGGKIRTLKDIEKYLLLGADKISINTIARENPGFITMAAREFGAQCIVVSIDVKSVDGIWRVYSHRTGESTALDPVIWAQQVEEAGAGEILLNSVDRDGVGSGYDCELLDAVSTAVNIPVIGCGGVGDWPHFQEGLEKTHVDAVAAANIFHYRDQSVFLAKKFLFEKGANVRRPDLITIR
jgi:cyclase